MRYKQNNKTSVFFTAVKFLFILCCLTLNPARAFAAVDINIASFTDTPDPVPSLGQFDYDLRIDNSGDTQADNVVLTVPIPPEVTIQSLTPGAGPIPNCTHSGGVIPAAAPGGTVTCNLGSVPASTNQLVTISAQATVPGPASAAITASVTTTTPGEINIANNSSGESTTITRGADLVLAKTGPAAAAGAEIITFNLDITNNGLNDATTFEIVDTLPPGFTYQSFSGAGWSCTPAGQVITCNHSGGILVGNMAPTLGIDVQVTAASTGVLVNSATTASTDPLVGDGDASNNTTTFPVTITAGTDLRVTKSVSSDPIIGDSIGETFTIQVNNLGPMTANNLTVTDAIPDTLAVGGFTVTNVAGAGWDCSGSAGLNVNCTRPTLAVGAAPGIVVTVDAPISADIPAGGEPQTNTATVTSTTTDPIPGNDSGGVSYTLQRNEADLGLLKSKTPNPVAVGSNMTSTITVRNFGPQTATGAMRVTDQLDVNETYVPVGSGGAGWTCTPAGQLITCDHANAGGTAPGVTLPDITIISTANAAGVLSNTACTSGSTAGGPTLPNEGDSNAVNDCSGAVGVLATAQIADLTLNKVVDKPVLVNNDNTLTYTLTVTNNGPDSATNVELNDNIPMFFTGPPATGVIAVPSQGACPTVGANVTCNLGTITNGSNATVTITVDRPMRDSVAQPGGIWTNTATAFSLDIGDDNRADNTDTATTAVNAATDLELQSKTVTPNPVLAGVETTYVMTIRNNGPSQADNVVLTDVFVPDAPETYTLISATPTSGSCNPLVGNTLTCNMGNMSSGQVQSVTVIVRPDYRVAAPATWNLHNDASVSTTTYEEDIALGGANNNTQSADLTVNTADIELLVNVADDVDPVPYDPAGAPPTNIITYEVILNNLGPSLATSVQFVDRITSMPAGQQLIFQCDKSSAGAACPALGSQICNNQSTVINPAPPVDITCLVGDLPANTIFTRYLDFEVQNQPAVSGDTVINQVTVSGAEPETILGNNVVTEETTVRVSTDLGITSKVAAPATASIMEPFNWTITVENNGAGDSQLTTVTDNLPAGMELTGAPVPAQGSCTGLAGSTSFSCSLGIMLSPPVLPVPPNPPTQTTITAPVRMTTYPGGGSVNNCAAVADTETVDQVPANDSNCGSVTITRSSIEGFVYIDLNNDGAMAGVGETGIAGVQINLTGTDAFGNAVNRNVNTDGAGRFFFNDLAPSNGAGYTLTQPSQPATLFDGMETAGSAGGNTAVNETISTIVLPANTASTGYLFGELASASISGTVYADTNGNSAQDAGEPGIPNVTVTLTGTDVNLNAINVPTTTDANGDFQFTNQPPSDATGYTITESHPNGWVDAGETAGSAGGNTAVNEVISAIPLVSAAAETGYLFGETGGSLAGIVYEDTNNDGVVDGFDPRLPAETVTLTGTDINGNPVNQVEATLADGSYLFENLASPNGAGYTITETQPAGFVDGIETLGTLGGTAGNNVFSAIPFPAAGADGTGYNFGELRAAQISGFVYRDLNDDGDMVGVGETGLVGIQMRLTGTDFFSVPVNLLVNTLADGSFSFDNLEPSDATGYTITQVAQPAGFIDGQENDKGAIVPGSIATDVISGIVLPQDTALPGHLFGEVPEADISGIVYADLDGDGSQGGGEPGIPNVTVTLTGTDFRGNAVNIPTLTNATGDYQFTALPPSNGTGYTITETQPGGWIDGTDVVGTAGGTLANDIISDIVLVAGASESGYLFGETGGSLAGTVYNDISGDGIKDPIEPGIPGTTVTLTGTDVNGTVINLVTTTDGAGDYLFEGLPVPNATGYTITETQPAGNTDGLDAVGSLGGTLGNDVLSDILFPAAGANGTDYDFGETTTITAQLSGTVWLDSNLDRVDNEAGGQSGWTVEIIQRVDPLDNTNFTLIATTTTDANGDYSFTGLIPGGGYEVRFLHPFNDSVFGNPQSVEPGVDLSFGTIRNLTLAGGANIIDQDQPLDPQGVVYDSLTRLPVAGASVTFNGPGGFDPALHLVGGLANQTQITDATGLYQFLLLGGAPAGTYTLTVVEPPGYLPGVSVIIPACTNTLTSVAVPDPALVHANVAAPIAASPIHNPATCPATTATLAATATSTQYYLSFVLTPGVSADVINNHIPVDLITQGALTTRKTTPKTNVVRGELVPYTISVTNNLTAALPAIIDIRDQIPAGFKYRVGSATLDGVSTEPTINGRLLTWPNNSFAAGEEHVINLLLVVGSGVGEGEYVNQAFAVNNLAGLTVSNVATATVRVIPDPLFDCTDLIGKVFNDQNANGYQDKGEPGVAAVKLATARGLIIKTDDKGRFHVPCAAVPNELRGSNFILKLDERSLPTGFRITTENPRVVRLTRGKMAKINFGASLFRVVRADVSAKAFKPDSYELSPKFSQHLEKLYNVLRKKPSVLRVSYLANGEDKKLIKKRLKTIRKMLKTRWDDCDCHFELIVEEEIKHRGRGK